MRPSARRRRGGLWPQFAQLAAPVSGSITKKKAVTIGNGDDKLKAKKVVVQQDQVSFVVEGRPFEVEGYVRLSGVLNDGVITGSGLLPAGDRFTFTITATGDIEESDDAEDPPASETPAPETPPTPAETPPEPVEEQ